MSKAACKGKVVDGSGTGLEVENILSNNDQFARFVLREGTGCPTDTTKVMAKLVQTSGCKAVDANGTMVVNEKSSHDALKGDKPDATLLAAAQAANRVVISRQCLIKDPVDPNAPPQKPCIGNDVFEFDFVFGQCKDSKNTPKCFTENSSPDFFQNKECVSCLTREDGKLHKDDLRRGEARCLDRKAQAADALPAFNLLLSTFASLGKDGKPGSVGEDGLEVIAFDASNGVFNFYKEQGGKWSFMGDSHDFHEGKGGFCRECHPSGGLVQKELPSPWFNWEISGDVPHSSDLIAQNQELMGHDFPLGGEGLETAIVRPGNDVMNTRRVELLTARVGAAKSERSRDRQTLATDDSVVFSEEEMHELLKPLFCTQEINFDTGTFGTNGIFISDFTQLSGFVNMPSGQYDAAITELGQVRGKAPLTSKDSSSQLARPGTADVFDSGGEGLYPKMVQANLLSQEFITDLQMVDFTRPLFSDDRCSLLQFVPAVTVGMIKGSDNLGQALVKAVIAKLDAAASKSAAATAFLANLREEGDAGHQAKVKKLTDACNARAMSEPLAFMKDVVKMVELMRQETENRLMIIEDFLKDDVWPSIPGMQRNFGRWNPDTCRLE